MTRSCLGNRLYEIRFEPAVVLHPVGQGVADEADMVAGFQLERCRGVGGRCRDRDRGEPGEQDGVEQHYLWLRRIMSA